MLKHRIIFGCLLAAGIGAILFGDAALAKHLPLPFYPFLFVFTMLAGVLATREMTSLIPEQNRPLKRLTTVGVLAMLGVHFYQAAFVNSSVRYNTDPQSWTLPAYVYGVFALLTFMVELYRYRATGNSISKIAHALLVVTYLGVLPSFFVKLRWLTFPEDPDPTRHDNTGLLLALAIFVPKCGDIAAYTFGRLFGKNKITPLLSPKKTWEGFIGSFVGSMFAAWLLSNFGNVFKYGWIEVLAFGIAIGFAGVLGDLAESLIKRDGAKKDSSQSVPGFGGLMDVFDSVIFAGPVVYLWLLLAQRGYL